MEDRFSQVKERIFEHFSKEIDSLKEEIVTEIQIGQQEYQDIKHKLELAEKKNTSQNERDLNLEAQYIEQQDKMDILIDIVHLCQTAMDNNENNKIFSKEAARLLQLVVSIEDGNIMLLLLNTFSKAPQGILQLDSKSFQIFINTLIKVFTIQFNVDKEEIYYLALRIINGYINNDGNKLNLLEVISKSKKYLDNNVYECFYLPLTMELMSTYLAFDLINDFHILFDDMLTDIDMWSDQLDETSFNKLLWYGFLADSDREFLMEIYILNSDLIINTQPTKQIYDVVFNMIHGVTVNDKSIEGIIMQFNDLESFTSKEKKEIINKIKSKLINVKKGDEEKKLKLKMQEDKQDIRKLDSVTKLSPLNLPAGTKMNNLHHEIIDLIVFRNSEMKEQLKLISVNVQTVNEKGEAFVTKKEIKRIRELGKPGYIRVIENKKINNVYAEQISNTIQEKNNFKWPETAVNEKAANSIDEQEGKSLNENSDLKLMGYQITGLTRAKRWEILQKAVPILGLKKVANTIAYNVKLRKGQKNGINKYHNAITEWEYDLYKLKKVYYRKEFSWPKT